jgi:hypothetical protein
VWDLPSPKSSGITSAVIGVWQLGTILSVSTGSPFTATVGAGGDPLGTGYNGDFSMDFATILPNCNPIHGGVNYLNLRCFSLPFAPASFASQCAGFPGAVQPPPSGMVYCSNLLGNAGRNTLYGPSLATVDLSMFKNFPVPRISETFRIQFRAELINVLNHPNFGSPGFLNPAGQNNSIFDATGAPMATAGVLNSTSTSSRQIQFGVKIIW